TPLLEAVNAPKALHLALSQIGYVESTAEAAPYIKQLQPGQAIVSLQGDYWRWDGLCMKAEAKDRNAQQLEQKNKLDALLKRENAVRREYANAQTALEKALASEKELRAKLDNAETALSGAQKELNTQRNELAALREERSGQERERESLKEV